MEGGKEPDTGPVANRQGNPPTWEEVMAQKQLMANSRQDMRNTENSRLSKVTAEMIKMEINGADEVTDKFIVNHDDYDEKTITEKSENQTNDQAKEMYNKNILINNNNNSNDIKYLITKKIKDADPEQGITNNKENNNKEDLCEIDIVNAETGLIKVLTIKERFIEAVKMTIEYVTILAVFFLCLCTIPVIYAGFVLLNQDLEVSRVVYQHEFHTLGCMCLATGVPTLLIFGPFGIWGTRRKVRAMLSWHNTWLFLNILFQLGILYILLRHMYRSERKQQDHFSKAFNKIYRSCVVNSAKTGEYPFDRCCCKEIATDEKFCWKYAPDPKKGDPNMRGYDGRCEDRMDYFDRTREAVKYVLYFLSIYMQVEAIPLFLVCIVLSITPRHPPDDVDGATEESTENLMVEVRKKSPKKKRHISLYQKMLAFSLALIQNKVIQVKESNTRRRKKCSRPRGRLQKTYFKARTVLCKRILYVVYTILFILALLIARLAYKGFVIEIGGVVSINVIHVIEEQIKILLLITPEPEIVNPEQ